MELILVIISETTATYDDEPWTNMVTFSCNTGGGSGIRTHDRVAPITVFKTVAFVLSAIPPTLRYYTSFEYNIGDLFKRK